jgi:hypothetical protein
MSFMEIFQPGLKFLREERERERMNVAYPMNGADPLMEIDLDAGTATIVVAAPMNSAPAPEVAQDLAAAVREPPDNGESSTQDGPSDQDEPSKPSKPTDRSH